MWNRGSLRLRITLCSALCLTVVCAILTVLLIRGAQMAFVLPLEGLMPDVGQTAVAGDEIQIHITIAQDNFVIQSKFLMLGMILIGSVLIWYVTGKALRPITALSQKVGEIDEHTIGIALPVPDSQDEVRALTVSFNQMMQRVSTAYEGQKTFAQNAAHELKTPVAGILATIDVLHLDDVPTQEDYKEAIENISASANRMEKLVQDLLLLNTVLREEPFSHFYFSEILKDFTAAFAEHLAQKEIDLQVDGDVELHGSKSLLERAFDNLLHNAIRYNVQGGTIKIVCKEDVITITDSGIGIPAEALSKIFDPFYCADPSRSRNLGGNGLGLNIARRIFEQHGMHISISSDAGTTVQIIL